MKRAILAILMSIALLASSFVAFPLTSQSKDIADTFTLKVTPGCGFNMLEWTPLTGASSYWIYRGPGPGQEYPTPLTDFPIPDTKFKDDINIENGKEYCYYLTGVNEKAEEFGRSNEACATPKCSSEEEPVPPEEEDCKLVLRYQIDNKNYYKNGAQLGPMESAPEIQFNRMFLLIRYVAQEVGALVEWDAAQKRVIIKTVDGNTIEIWVGKPKAKVNGVEKAIDPNNPKVVGYIKGGRVLMPMRFVAENLGATGPEDIKWFEATKTVELYFGDPECRKCVCLTVAKVDCNAKPPTAYCTDKKGKNWTVYISLEMCKQIKVGGCYSFCGYVRKPNTTPTTAAAIQPIYMWATVLKPAACPCPDETPNETDAKCVCITIEKNECTANGNMVSGVGDDGNVYILEVTADQCAKMVPGTCWKVCGTIVRRINDKTALMKVLKAEKVDCPCKPRNDIVKEKKDCKCFTVERIDCNAARPTVYAKDENGTLWQLYVTAEQCRKFVVGKCYKACGLVPTMIRVGSMPYMKVETFEETTCPCKTDDCEWILGEILGFDKVNTGSATLYRVQFRKCGEQTIMGYVIKEDMLDASGRQKISEYKGCARICVKDGVIIKWERVINVQECCASIDCDWVLGEFTTTWNYQTKTISFKPCGKDVITLKSDTDMQDESKKFPLSQYKGCAKVCIKDGVIIKWIALWDQKPCCPEQVKTCICATIDDIALTAGYIMVTDENGKKWKVFVPAGIIATMKKGECWKICGQDVTPTAVTFAPIPTLKGETFNKTDCPCKPGGTPDEKCVCLTVQKINCDSNNPTVQGVDENGNQWVFVVSPEICKKLLALFREKGEKLCIKICGVPIPGTNLWKMTSYEMVDCPCATPVEKICRCVKIKRVDCNSEPPKVYGTDENGNDIVLVLTKEQCARYGNYLVPEKCIKVCGVWVKIALGPNIDGLGLKIETIEPIDCERCKPQLEEKCVCLTVMRISCDSDQPLVYGVDENGTPFTFVLPADVCQKLQALYKEKGGKLCIKICGVRVPGTNLWKMTKFEVVDCPCKPPEPQIECRCVKILKVDCESDPPKVYGTDENGNSITLVLEKWMCQSYANFLVPEKCIKVCGTWITINTSATSYLKALKVGTLAPIDCAECKPQQEEKCVCLTVKKINCDSDQPTVLGVDENGVEYTFVISQEYCKKLAELWQKTGGKVCIKICGVRIPGTNLWKMTKMEFVDCPCKPQEPKIDCYCVKILKVDCTSEPPKVYVKDENGNEMTLVLEKWMCERYANFLVPEKCLKVCGTWIKIPVNESTTALGFKVTSVAPIDCSECKPPPPPPENCFCFTLEKFEEFQGGVYIIGTADTGAPTRLYLRKEIWEKYKDILKIGKCYIICLDPTGAGNYTIKPTDCPCKPAEPKLDCHCVKITKVDCTLDPPRVFGNDENGNPITIYLEKWMCEKYSNFLVPERCIKVCGTWVNVSTVSAVGAKALKAVTIDPIDCKECKPQEPIEKCVCLTIQKFNCDSDQPTIYGVDENGVPYAFVVPADYCKKIAELWQKTNGKVCVKICGVRILGTTLWKMTKLEFVDCPCKTPPTNDECFCFTLEKFEESRGGVYIIGTADTGAPTKLFLKTEVWEKYKGILKPGGCYKICLDPTGAGNYTITPTECPCKPPVPKDECHCVTILKVDCTSDPPKVYGKDENGNTITLVLEKWMCEKYGNFLVPERCIKVCGVWTGSVSAVANIKMFKVTSLEPTECPCKPIEQPTDCEWKRVSIMSTNNDPWVQTTYGSPVLVWYWLCGYSGITNTTPAIGDIKADNAGLTLVAYRGCAEICIKDGKIVRWRAFPNDTVCCTGPQRTGRCVTVTRQACSENPPAVYGTTNWNELIKLTFTNAADCARFVEKSCWWVNGIIGGGGTGYNVSLQVESFSVSNECPCKVAQQTSTPCITLDRVDCNQATKVAWGKDATGQEWMLNLGGYPCANLRPGMCIIATGYAGGFNKLRAMDVISIQITNCPCAGQPAEEKCFCVTIEKVDCEAKPPVAYARDKNNVLWMIQITPEACKLMRPGTCWEICGIPIEQNSRIPSLRLTKFKQTDCPCAKPEGEMGEICVTIMRQNCDFSPPYIVGQDENGDMWQISVSPDLCARFKIGTCWILYGRKIIDPNGTVMSLIKVEKYTQTDCPCKKTDELKCMCVEIVRVNCDATPPTVYAKTPEGVMWILQVPMDYCKRMMIGSCWEVCGYEINKTAANAPTMSVKKAREVECPCGEKPVIQCICITIERQDCNSTPPKVYGKEANGRTWVLEVPLDLCKKMVPGTCWNVCGPVTKSATVDMPIMKVEKFDQVKCPCGSQTPEEPCFCVEVVDVVCTANGGRVYAKDLKGNMWVLFVGPDICQKIKPKTCWKVCGTKGESENGIPTLKVTKIEQTTCPCDGGGQGEPSGKCVCFKVVRQVCDTDNPYVVYIDEDGNRGIFYTSSLGGKEMCEKMKVGTCWIKCQYTDASGMVVLTVSPDPNCSCKEPQLDCFCVEVIKSDCSPGKPPTIVVKNSKGSIFEVNLPADLAEYCQKMTVGTCWKICGRMMTMADGVMKFLVTTIDQANCPCEPEVQDCKPVRGKIVMTKYSDDQLWVSFQDCDGNSYSYFSIKDLPDTTGVYPLSQYTGCAIICVNPDGSIAYWKALPNEECCP